LIFADIDAFADAMTLLALQADAWCCRYAFFLPPFSFIRFFAPP